MSHVDSTQSKTDLTQRRIDLVTMTDEQIRALPALLSVSEVAQALNMHRQTAYNLLKEGRFPIVPVMVASRRKFRRADVVRLLGIQEPAA
jgi:excisionase family DNA binding protein